MHWDDFSDHNLYMVCEYCTLHTFKMGNYFTGRNPLQNKIMLSYADSCRSSDLRLAISTGSKRVGAFLSTKDGNRTSFQNVAFPSFQNTGQSTKSKNPIMRYHVTILIIVLQQQLNHVCGSSTVLNMSQWLLQSSNPVAIEMVKIKFKIYYRQ